MVNLPRPFFCVVSRNASNEPNMAPSPHNPSLSMNAWITPLYNVNSLNNNKQDVLMYISVDNADAYLLTLLINHHLAKYHSSPLQQTFRSRSDLDLPTPIAKNCSPLLTTSANGTFQMLDPKLGMSCLYQASGLDRPQCVQTQAEEISVWTRVHYTATVLLLVT